MAHEGNDPAALRSIANRNLTKSMQTLLGICSGITADNHINDSEIHFLKTWLTENSQIIDAWPACAIAAKVWQILQDGIIEEEERAHMLHTLKEITGNHFSETGAAQAEIIGIPFDNMAPVFQRSIFCFTGEFIAGTRKYCRTITEKLGGITVDTMTRKVNYLVIGALASPDWKHESYGNKIESALQLRAINHPIAIITEKHWNNAIQPPS